MGYLFPGRGAGPDSGGTGNHYIVLSAGRSEKCLGETGWPVPGGVLGSSHSSRDVEWRGCGVTHPGGCLANGSQFVSAAGTVWRCLACVLGSLPSKAGTGLLTRGDLISPSGDYTSGDDGDPVFKPCAQSKALKTLIALTLSQEAPKDLAGAGLPGCPLCRQNSPRGCLHRRSQTL